MLFKVAGYADAAKQQADADSVQPHSTAAAGQAGECLVAAPSHLLFLVSVTMLNYTATIVCSCKTGSCEFARFSHLII